MPKNNKWICREWEFDIADTNFKEDDFERINLLKKYGNLLNPKIQVSLTEKKSKNTRNWLRLGAIGHLLCERI